MSRSLRPTTLALAGVAFAIVGVVVLAAGPGRAAATTPVATATPAPRATTAARPIASTTAQPTTAPTAQPSVAPATAGNDGASSVTLETVDGHTVTVSIVDETGTVTGAVTGHPGDGASVEAYTLDVANVDATTLRLRWIDFPIDNQLTLLVSKAEDGRLRLVLVQPEPHGGSDAIGFDRELVLSFGHPVDASNVETFLQDGLDTEG